MKTNEPTVTYYKFIMSLPENARIKLLNSLEGLTKTEYLRCFSNFTGLNPKTTKMLDCEFTILFI